MTQFCGYSQSLNDETRKYKFSYNYFGSIGWISLDTFLYTYNYMVSTFKQSYLLNKYQLNSIKRRTFFSGMTIMRNIIKIYLITGGTNSKYMYGYRLRRYYWFSFNVTKIQTTKLSILPRFYFHDVLEQLKTNFHTNFRFKRVPGFVIQYASISKLLRDAAFTWRPRELSCRFKKWFISGNFAI